MDDLQTQLSDNTVDTFYTLDRHWITENARHFNACFPGTVLYAVKANPLPEVISALHLGGIQHFDVASLAEVAIVDSALQSSTQYLMNPVKSRHCIHEAYYRFGVRCFVLDSPQELSKLREELPNDDSSITAFVRYAPSQSSAVYDLRGKFGVAVDQAADLIHLLESSTQWDAGLSFHVGSQAIETGPYLNALNDAQTIIRAGHQRIRHLDVGGGFPGIYLNSKGNTPELIDAISDQIATSAALKELNLICEAGRSLVYGGMTLFARVIARHEQNVFCGAGIFGGLLSAQQWLQFPVQVWRDGEPYNGGGNDVFQIFGPTCDSMDRLAFPYTLVHDLAEGDWLEFQSTGAYSVSLRTPFNGFYADRVVVLPT